MTTLKEPVGRKAEFFRKSKDFVANLEAAELQVFGET